MVDESTPTAVYTGMDREDGIGSVMLARATDATLTTLKAEPEPVVPGPPPGLDLNAFRDPYLFTHEGTRWAVVGAGHRATGTGDVLLYRVHSLTDWSYLRLPPRRHRPHRRPRRRPRHRLGVPGPAAHR